MINPLIASLLNKIAGRISDAEKENAKLRTKVAGLQTELASAQDVIADLKADDSEQHTQLALKLEELASVAIVSNPTPLVDNIVQDVVDDSAASTPAAAVEASTLGTDTPTEVGVLEAVLESVAAELSEPTESEDTQEAA